MKSRILAIFVLTCLTATLDPRAIRADGEPTPTYQEGMLQLTGLPAIPEDRVGWAGGGLGDAVVLLGGAQRPSIAAGLKADEASHSALVLLKDATAWKKLPLELPVAFAAVYQDGKAIYTFGGINAEGRPTDAVIKTTLVGEQLVQQWIGQLPRPLALGAAVALKGKVYVAGGVETLEPLGMSRKTYFVAQGQLAVPPGKLFFDEQEGPAIIAPAMATQYTIEMYLLGGWRQNDEGQFVASAAVHSVAPRAGVLVWREKADAPMGLTGAAPIGQSHLLVIGQPATEPVGRVHEIYRLVPSSQPAAVWTYHINTDRWVRFPDLHDKESPAEEVASPLVSPLLFARGKEVVALGGLAEIGEGRLPAGIFSVQEKLTTLTTLDYTIIGVYFVAMLAIGWRCSQQEQTGTQYFIGGRKIPFWASAISVYATGTSAISFMAIPAQTYMESLVYLVQPLLTSVLIVAFVFPVIGLLRRLEVTTIYEYLEQRFNRAVQQIGSLLALTYQIGGRMSIVILLPAMGMHAVTGVDRNLSILLMGLITVVYTWSGGMKAVIWTDIIQAVLKLGGTIFCFLFIIAITPGGFGGYIDVGLKYGKFDIFDFTFDLTLATFWMALICSVCNGMCWVSDQANLQRVFGTESPHEARKTVLLSAFLTVPGALVFFGVGTALFYFYHNQPEMLCPTLENDKIYPLFISQKLTWGLAGLLIAALFAASMSTLSGVTNTAAAMVVRDLVRPFRPNITEHSQAVLGKWVTLVVGIVSTSIALWMANSNIQSMFQVFNKYAGLLGGGMPAVIMLGLFTKRTTGPGVLIGLAVSLVTTFLLSFTDLHALYYTPAAIAVCLVTGYAASLLLPGKPKDLAGLTIFATRKI